MDDKIIDSFGDNVTYYSKEGKSKRITPVVYRRTELELKKAGLFKKAVYPVRRLLRRLWHLIRPKSWAKSHGLRKGDIINFEGVGGINDGDYEITGVSDPKEAQKIRGK